MGSLSKLFYGQDATDVRLMKKYKTASDMLSDGHAPEDVIEITGLSDKEVKMLQKNMASRKEKTLS